MSGPAAGADLKDLLPGLHSSDQHYEAGGPNVLADPSS